MKQPLAIKGGVLDEGITTMPVRFDQIEVPKCNVSDGGDR